MRIFLSIFVSILVLVVSVSAKSRVGEYFLGFGYSIADSESDDREGDFFRLTAQAPNNQNSDVGVYFDYGTMEIAGKDASSWNLGADYIGYLDGLGRSIRIIPYLGAGIGYLNDEKPIRLGEDGFTWSLQTGVEVGLSRSLSLNLGGRFFGIWSDFGENEFTADAAIGWWFNHVHGISIEYQRAFEAELNFFTLKYLYSWQ